MATTPETPFTPTQQAWRDAVAIVTLRAKDSMGPAHHTRLDKAQALVLEHAVTPHDDGHRATVQSETDKGKAYTVNGACECVDATRGKAPEGWCKHRLAWAIYRRAVRPAQELLAARTETVRLPEAPVSVTLKGPVRGRPNTLVTVRGVRVADVEAQLDAAERLFDAPPPAGPQQEPESKVACREVPTRDEEEKWCEEHHTIYYKNIPKRGGKPWWSHRLAEGGWCRAKG